MSLGYRIKQFWRGLMAQSLSEDQKRAVKRQLTTAQWQLFNQFAANDQQHSFRVWQQLKDEGENNQALLRAALLHDIGKIRQNINLIQRSWIVIGQAFFPAVAHGWGRRPLDQARWWEKPFVVRLQHPQWGAAMVRSLDEDQLLGELIERHQEVLTAIADLTYEESLLSRLQRADEAN